LTTPLIIETIVAALAKGEFAMIDLKLLDGQTASVAPSQFIRIRAAFTPSERQSGAVAIVDADDRYSVLDQPEAIAAALRSFTPVPLFNAPNGLDIFVSAKKVVEVLPATQPEDHDLARAVLILPGHTRQQIRQTVEEAKERLARALPPENTIAHDDQITRFHIGEISRPDTLGV
jgi:hypothetical protein